ncbi:PRC-barrel domain-containing protein [Roseomonas sp. SSH11]|uniref:PRC-barrel domain-containing protein n=1 Tax=Pararoseomonas baculiformis TaxID=2820812 RepID=A0ABS4AJ20_9PROT|nr:PRC-barrel domain-containing protein [Pararoseomonas baculiformis]MBP0447032.1 PRC-barrel domain-containing protein [Pararoseomonas baculiformis]
MTDRSYKSTLMGLTAAAALLAGPALAQTQATPRDGTPGNPPSTATQRAADRATGNQTQPDGTPGNPPGTALGRAADRAGDAVGNATDRAADNASAANRRAGDPLNLQGRPDGTPGNPPGTALGRTIDSAVDTAADNSQRPGNVLNAPERPDGTAGNPPGTVVTRGLDRALGTNMSGAFPRNEGESNGANSPDHGGQGATSGTRATVTGRGPAAEGGVRETNPPAASARTDIMGSTQSAPAASGGQGPGATNRPANMNQAANANLGTNEPRATSTNQANSQGQNSQGQNSQGPNAQGQVQPGAVNRTPDGDQARAGTMTVPLQNQAANTGTGTNANMTGSNATATTGAQGGQANQAGTDRSASGMAAGTAATAPAAQTERVSRIIGSNVYNERNESIGSIDDVILPSGNSSPLAIVSVGGFLGIGAKLVAVPMSDLRWSAADNRWTITGATRESLTSLPAYSYDAARRG